MSWLQALLLQAAERGAAKPQEVAEVELGLELEGLMVFVAVLRTLAPAAAAPAQAQQEMEVEDLHLLAARGLAHTVLPIRPRMLA
jgi:hypothetical protein